VFHITEDKHHKKYFKDFELHTIELNKFSNDSKQLQENLSDLVVKIKNALDLWVTFLTRYDLLKKDPLPKAFNNPYLKKAIKVLNIMNFSEQEKEDYEGHLKWLRTEASALQFELEKGIEIGKEEGIKIEKKEIVLTMLSQNFNDETIMTITKLSQEEINKIKQEK
jgi:predicted transposase/invertase (TIGR01784 family)